MRRPLLHAVSSRHRLAPDARTEAAALAALEDWLVRVIGAGVDVVHVRERDAPSGALRALVSRAVHERAGSATRVIVNDRADVARAAEADGVHLPSSGLEPAEVRAWWPDATIGRSVHAQDHDAVAEACDYVFFGAVFPTASKPGQPPAGVDALERAVARWTCPVVAIGGMTPETSAAAIRVGASGVAAIGAFLTPGRDSGALGPEAAVRAFRQAWGEVR